jgi:polyhydroxyalkanoate synthesis regulator phasin
MSDNKVQLYLPSYQETVETSSIEEAERMVDQLEMQIEDIQNQIDDRAKQRDQFGVEYNEEVYNWLNKAMIRRRYFSQKRSMLVKWLEKQEGSFFHRLREQRNEIFNLYKRVEALSKWSEPINSLLEQIEALEERIEQLEEKVSCST